MDKREYIRRWAKKLLGYITKKYRHIGKAEDEIFNVIREHMKNVCENVEVDLENVGESLEYDYSICYTFRVKCDDEEMIIRAIAYDYVDIEIDEIDDLEMYSADRW
jgi:hypothetical protein